VLFARKSILKPPKVHLSQSRTRVINRAAYVLLTVVIVASSLIIAVRATGGVREDYLENFYGAPSPNLTVKGTLNSVALNYEVNIGYNYHIFPAYLSVNVTEVVWGGHLWVNQTTTAEYLQHRGNLIVYFENNDVPILVVGQQVEISGYYSSWREDSLYSNTLVVSSNVNGSYLKGS
jgi:hypothetical protein